MNIPEKTEVVHADKTIKASTIIKSRHQKQDNLMKLWELDISINTSWLTWSRNQRQSQVHDYFYTDPDMN